MPTWTTRELADGGRFDFAKDFLSPEEAESMFIRIHGEIAWEQTKIFGRPAPRLTAWYADPGVNYSYSGINHVPRPWTPILSDLRSRIEAAGDEFGLIAGYNSVLLNRYRSGQDSMGFHADDEPELGINPIIGSLSLGATRRFVLRHNITRESITLTLSPGSLLIMSGTTQHHWQHAIPKTTVDVCERINLTFRRTHSAI